MDAGAVRTGAAMPHTSLHHVGIAFDIDGLADFMYGFAAYRLLFAAVIPVNRDLFSGCRFWDGDTRETLAGNARDYVIAVGAVRPEVPEEIRRLLERVDSPGLKAPGHRFLSGRELLDEPLVFAASINALGVMENCDTSWVLTAWDMETRAAQGSGGPAPKGDGNAQRLPD